MLEKEFKVLNDYFMRYLLSKEDSQNILKDLINQVRIDAGQEGFEEVTILNTFNLKESINGKETIVDVRAKTKNGETVVIESTSWQQDFYLSRTLLLGKKLRGKFESEKKIRRFKSRDQHKYFGF